MKCYRNILAVIKVDDETNAVDSHVLYLLDRLSECLGGIRVLASASVRMEPFKGKSCKLSVYQEEIPEDVMRRRADLEKETIQYEKVMVLDTHCFGPTDMTALSDMLEYIDSSKDGDGGCYEILPGHLAVFETTAFVQRMALTGAWHKDFIKILVTNLPEDAFFVVPERFATVFFDIESLMDMDINVSSGENPRRILERINDTSYDTKLIWDKLLDRYNVEDIKNALHLEYILPWKYNPGPADNRTDGAAALIAHLYYEDLVSECFCYLEQIPADIDIYITTSNQKTLQEIKARCTRWERMNYRIIWKENRGRDVSALLVACHDILMKYEFIGFVHDKKSRSYLKRKSEAASFQYNIWENMLKSRAYIRQVLQCFRNNPRLGLLVPPEPYYASLMGYLGESWGRCYEATRSFAGKLGLDCQLEESSLPITVSTTFWCRAEALKPLFTYPFRYEDFPQEPMSADGTFSHVIEHILAYVAQHQRFYTAILMNDDYASLRGNGLQMLLIRALNEMRKEAVILKPDDIDGYRDEVEKLITFCGSYHKIYIYGAGTYGKKCHKVLKNHYVQIEGFVISDDKKFQEEWDGMPVYSLSELRGDPEQCGFVLALNSGNLRAVIPLLEERGYKNRYHIE